MRWFDYPIGVPFGNPEYDAALGGSHDLTILAPPNMAVTSLVSGYVSDVSAPAWGKQVGIELDGPINGVGWFHYLHLSAINPTLSLGARVEVGQVIGWVGGGNTQEDYAGTSNPTGKNFLNSAFNSSRVQVGLALMRGPAYGSIGWQHFPPIDWSLDPTPLLEKARKQKEEEIPMVDYPEAINKMVPLSYSYNSNAHRKIVNHCTGGNMTLDSIYQTFMETMRSTHFGIDRQGRVAQFVPLDRGAGGNCCPDHDAQGHIVCSAFWLPLLAEFGNLNLCTISIEHCNDSENSLPLTDAQVASSNKLNLWLCQRYHLTTGDIHSHASINPVNKARCPGPAFDFGQMFDFINDGLATGGKTDVFSNELCIAVYESYFKSIGKAAPPRETGIFRSWRALWISGHFMGCCLSGEYPVTLPNGHAGVAQDYAGGVCVWDSTTSIPTWL